MRIHIAFMESIFPQSQVEWYASLLIFILSILIAFLVRALFKGRLKGLSNKTATPLDDLFLKHAAAPLFWLVILCGVFIAGSALPLPAKPYDCSHIFKKVMETLVALNVAWLLLRTVNLFHTYLIHLKNISRATVDDRLLRVIRKVLHILIIIITALLVIQNLGYSVTGLWAGLGIGGLAVALAARDTLANIFGSIIIFTDRLFKVGDTVSVAGVKGTVEDIGFRSTRIRSASHSLFAVPNSIMTSATVENISAQTKQIVDLTFTIPPARSRNDILEMKRRISQVFVRNPLVEKDTIRVYVSAVSNNAITLQIMCDIKPPKDEDVCKFREALYLDVLDELKEMGVISS